MKSLQEIINERVAFGAWCVFEEELKDPEKCRRAAELGLDFGYTPISPENYQTILKNCEEAGMRVMAFVSGVTNLPADQSYLLERIISDYKSSPAYAGTALRDEPGVADFPRLKKHLASHRQAAPDKIGLINLFPMYASSDQLGGVDYETYISRFAAEVDDAILSYDFYPLYGQEAGKSWIQDDYLRNFEIVAREAQKRGSQMWFFIQTLAFNYALRDPDENDLRWQIFCALSFGARVIQLFTYGTPANGDEYFEDSLIDRAGDKTFRYDIAQKVIAEFNGWTGRYVPYRWAGAMTRGKGKSDMGREFDVVFPGGIVHKRRLRGSYMDLDHELCAFAPVKDFSGDAPLLMGCFEKKGGAAFTLVNMADPGTPRKARCAVDFTGPVKLRVSGRKETYEADCAGRWEVELDRGEGLFAEIVG